MDEAAFNALAERELALIEAAFEALDLDVEMQPGGVLQIEFANATQMVINRHSVAREIWVAAKAGGFHFRYDGAAWCGTRDGEELWAALRRTASAQAGAAVNLQRGE